MTTLPVVITWAVAACAVYLTSVCVAFVCMYIVSALQQRYFARESRTEDYELLAASRFTIPVSVIAPAYNEAPVIEATVRSLLALTYPELEVIVVNDGSTDGTLDVLRRAFDLEPREAFVRRRFDTRRVRATYVSRLHPNLTVIDKENGGKADALNAGVNAARFRYICTVDADTVYYGDALVRSMRVAMRDAATVVGVTSSVDISRHPEQGDRRQRRYPGESLLTAFQALDYLRAFLNNRIGWTRGNFMLCSVGAFSLWRRDVVVEMGGFSTAFTCEDIEFTFRVHHRFRRARQRYRVIALPDSVGSTEGPDTISSLIRQRARWQRVIAETVWHYRRMLFNPRYGSIGLVGTPYYLLVEVLAPFFQILSVVTIPLAWWAGILDWSDLALVLITIAAVNGLFTNLALLLIDDGPRTYELRDLGRLMALGFVDLFLYRPVLIVAQAKGMVDFMRGMKSWDKFDRNYRRRST